MLRHVFQTSNELTMSVSGTGSAGMETCVVNLIEPGDRMLVCVNGVFGGKDLTEGAFDLRHLGTAASCHISHPTAKDPIHADQHPVARLDEIDDARLHPSTAGAADRHRQLVAGLENLPQHRLDFVHHFQKVRVEMPDRWCPECGEYRRSNVARSRSHQNPTRWTQRSRHN